MPVAVYNRHSEQIVFGDKATDVLAVGQGPHGDGLTRQRDRKHRVLRRSGHEAPERNGFEQDLRLRIDHVDGVDRLAGAFDFADVLQCFANGQVDGTLTNSVVMMLPAVFSG